MGTAQLQGALWSERARYWATLQERALLPAFETVLTKLAVDSTTTHLDIACGTGLATWLAALRGAQVSGLDASAASIEIARERVPQGSYAIGEIEELPYPDHTFDVVTGFNAFQYAAHPLRAIQEARRVTKMGGKVAMVFWGRPQDCEHDVTLKAVGTLLPPPPPGAPAPLALSEPGVVEELLQQAELSLLETGEVDCPFDYPDDDIALQAICSAGPVVRAIHAVGQQKVYDTVLASLAPYKQKSGGYRQKNKFRYFITRTSNGE